MNAISEQQISMMSAAIKERVRQHLHEDFQKLKDEMIEKISSQVDNYEKFVFEHIDITVETNVKNDESYLNMRVKINPKEAIGRIRSLI